MSDQHDLAVDCSFPGGNIVVDRLEGGFIDVHQDLRDTEGDWFYWYFRVLNAAGRDLTITFTGSDVFTSRGPAFSLDQGVTWAWLGKEEFRGQSFRFLVPSTVDDIRFSVGMSYVQWDLDAFLAPYANHPALERGELCKSRQGRSVELLRLGCIHQKPKHRLLLTARHHCCEMMASYVLEGILESILKDNDLGRWYQENVEVVVVPFVDKDGVENGDQGKNRRPHDHNRDYLECIYPETAAIKALVDNKGVSQFTAALDLHCPWIRGEMHERIHFVGGPDQAIWKEVCRFSSILQQSQTGILTFNHEHNLPFGVDWNNGIDLEMKSFSGWVSRVPGIKLAACLEIPYANNNGEEVNAETSQGFGRDLAGALSIYFRQLPVSK